MADARREGVAMRARPLQANAHRSSGLGSLANRWARPAERANYLRIEERELEAGRLS